MYIAEQDWANVKKDKTHHDTHGIPGEITQIRMGSILQKLTQGRPIIEEEWADVPYAHDEITRTLKNPIADKSTGPDGIPAVVYET